MKEDDEQEFSEALEFDKPNIDHLESLDKTCNHKICILFWNMNKPKHKLSSQTMDELHELNFQINDEISIQGVILRRNLQILYN